MQKFPFKISQTLALLTAFILVGWTQPWVTAPLEANPASTTRALDAKTYTIDAAHSGLLFKIRHLDLSWCWGRFTRFSGTLTHSSDPSACAVKVTIDPASIDTASEGRDKHLRGSDFLNVAQFPEASFESTKVTRGDSGEWQIHGTFKLHGVSKEVVMQATIVGSGDRGERYGERIGFEGRFQFNRRDFGITTYPAKSVGDTIEMIVAIEGQLK